VVVTGDLMLDDWRFTRPERLCREAAVPVVTLRQQRDAAGGAGNTAVNLAALGARPVLLAPVGDDRAGRRVRACLADAGVADRTLTVPGRPTCAKRRFIVGDQLVLCEEQGGEPGPLPPAAVRRLLRRLDGASAGSPVLVVCDYGRGALDDRVRDWLISHRDRFGMIALDSHDLRPWAGLNPDVITPSYAEAAELLRLAPGPDRSAVVLEHARDLLASTGARVAAVTLDTAGAVVVTADGPSYRTGTRAAPANHTVGAGDAYLAAITLALADGAAVSVAAEIAQLAAAATVAVAGTCVCSGETLLEHVGADARAGRVVDAAELDQIVGRHRERGDRIVFTNGCFDVLHPGHVGYLAEAAKLGEVLIVAVNSDAGVRRLKGPGRPVNRVEDRIAVLAALSCVDYVVAFDGDSPAALIEAIRPDLYVKGGDYHPDTVPEAPLVRRLGGEVRTLTYLPDRSTSAVIERIRSRTPLPRPSRIDAAP
jgi:D-beta-D-heptose 7-phosphate kinase/D-beta-D-heptose 1-phosphate adenosyltransferase